MGAIRDLPRILLTRENRERGFFPLLGFELWGCDTRISGTHFPTPCHGAEAYLLLERFQPSRDQQRLEIG